MIDNDRKTATPPARQQANRIRLAEDLRSDLYRQWRGRADRWHDSDAPDGRNVCVMGAAYETARHLQSADRDLLPVVNHSCRIFRDPVKDAVRGAYGFSPLQILGLMLKNDFGGATFEQLADVILKMRPADQPGPATRLRNRLTGRWRSYNRKRPRALQH